MRPVDRPVEDAPGDGPGPERAPFDREAYERRVLEGPCFVCRTVAHDPAYRHEIVYEDEEFIAFLDRWPTLVGRTLVAPRRHLEHVVGDLDLLAFQRLMAVVHAVGRAVERAVPTERLYLASLGSQQGNRHLHWHVASLPPGVPYERQQLHALAAEHGVYRLDAAEQARLAARIRAHLAPPAGAAAKEDGM